MSGWRKIKEHPIQASDADEQGCVLAWHEYNGCIITEWHWAEDNSLVKWWMPLPEAPSAVDSDQ